MESYIDDEGQPRVARLLPCDVPLPTTYVPPPDYVPVVTTPERTPTPPARYVPEPCTPPGPDDMPSNEAIQAKFAARLASRRTESKEGGSPDNEGIEHTMRPASTRQSSSVDLEASPGARPQSSVDIRCIVSRTVEIRNVPTKKGRGRPRKTTGPKVAGALSKTGRKTVWSESTAEDPAFLMSDDDIEESDWAWSSDGERDIALEGDHKSDMATAGLPSDSDTDAAWDALMDGRKSGMTTSGLPSDNGASPITSRRLRRGSAATSYEGVTAQEAEDIKGDKEQAMCSSDGEGEVNDHESVSQESGQESMAAEV